MTWLTKEQRKELAKQRKFINQLGAESIIQDLLAHADEADRRIDSITKEGIEWIETHERRYREVEALEAENAKLKEVLAELEER